jgi:hypothetical protein
MYVGIVGKLSFNLLIFINMKKFILERNLIYVKYCGKAFSPSLQNHGRIHSEETLCIKKCGKTFSF